MMSMQYCYALPQKSLSFTPGFSLVRCTGHYSETVSTVSCGKEWQTVETVFCLVLRLVTRLKPGVNDRDS